MDKKFPIKMISYLDSIVQHGTFTKAAKALYISQPYLTQSIQKVEEALGITIIDRSNTPLTLTKAGHFYYQQLNSLVKHMNQIERELLMYSRSFEETIRIGILSSLGTYLLPLFLPDFINEYGFYNFEIKEQLPMESERDLMKREIDFYIGQTPKTVNANVEKITSGKHSYYVIIPKKSCFYNEDQTIITEPTFELKDLLQEEFVLTKPGSAIRKQIDEIFYQYRQTPKTIMESENIYTIAALARKGAGLTIIPENVLLQTEDFNGYNLYKLPTDVITFQYFIAYLPEKNKSPMEEHLLHFFMKKIDQINKK